VNDNDRWEMWRTWLGDEPKGETIYAQVVEMMAYRQTWDVFADVYNVPPVVPARIREVSSSRGSPDG
jgi:hypothetical protein